MGITRRALTILGLTGITATSAGYWYLRTPKTIVEPRSSDQVEQYSFVLESESYVETGSSHSGKFVIYDPETLDMHIRNVPWFHSGDSNILPPGEYNVSTLGYLPEIKAAPLYYLRQLDQDIDSDSVSLKTITENQVDFSEYFDTVITSEERIYFIAPVLETFETVQAREGRNVVNLPNEPINRISGVGNIISNLQIEYDFRLAKKIFDPIISNSDQRIKQQYQSMWDKFEQYMASHKVSAILALLLDGNSIASNILNKLTNIQTINSINYDIDLTGIDPDLSFYTKSATVSNNQAIVPVGLRIFLSSDLPTIEKDAEIYTNTFNVPAVLTSPLPSTEFDYLSGLDYNFRRLDYNYRQWIVDYEDIRSEIVNSIEDSIGTL